MGPESSKFFKDTFEAWHRWKFTRSKSERISAGLGWMCTVGLPGLLKNFGNATPKPWGIVTYTYYIYIILYTYCLPSVRPGRQACEFGLNLSIRTDFELSLWLLPCVDSLPLCFVDDTPRHINELLFNHQEAFDEIKALLQWLEICWDLISGLSGADFGVTNLPDFGMSPQK